MAPKRSCARCASPDPYPNPHLHPNPNPGKASRLEKKHAEKSEIVAKVAECQERLALKKVEIEKLLEKDKLIMAEMSQALGEGNKYSEVLLTIFKKKVDLGEI